MKIATWLASAFLFASLALVASGQEKSQPATPESNAGQAPGPSTQTPQKAGVKGNIEVLTDTQGVDFGPYLSRVLKAVRMNWYGLIPERARPPELKQGEVSIEFVILPDGHVAAMRITESSGDVALDRSAWGGITASAPFAPLPGEFHGPYLGLRFNFFYNPSKMVPSPAKPEQK